jgi:type 2 lantibiotic biosynthesis protein LanM
MCRNSFVLVRQCPVHHRIHSQQPLMGLTSADLRFIVARSSTVFERATGAFASDPAGDGDARPESRIERLKQRAAGGDANRFERYLRWHGWDAATMSRTLGDVVYQGDVLPDWTSLLEEIGAVASSRTPGQGGDASTPFAEALAPWVDLALKRLRARTAAPDAATCRAWVGFEHSLLRRLAHIAARTLYVEFSAFRVHRSSQDATRLRSFSPALVGASRVDYDAFVAQLHEAELDRLLLTYPVLARLLATCVLDWTEATSEFLHRFHKDTPALEEMFANGRPLGPIADVITDLSDPHHGGRTVNRVVFASGLQVVYKPRSLASEAAFSSLLRWLKDGRLPLSLKAPAVLDCGTHGWMEYVASAPCSDAAGVERYYTRAGMLLALAYVLGGSDLHQGNLIACGDHPVLIDLEAFMGAPPRLDGPQCIEHEAGLQIWDSVLRTGLLPANRLGLHGRAHRNGGFVPSDPGYRRRIPHWVAMNTDRMALQFRSASAAPSNLPHAFGAAVPAESHVDAVVEGFRRTCEVLRHFRDELINPEGVLQPFFHARSRIVLRDTAAYATLLDRGLHPRLLQDGADWSIELELLKASATVHEVVPRLWPALLAEQRALIRLDIPLFTSTSDQTSIEGDGERVTDYLALSGRETTRTRLGGLDEERTQVQQHCIRVALRAQPQRPGPANGDTDVSATTELARAPWLKEALAIADTLRSAADQSNGRDVRWIGIRGLSGSSERSLDDVGWDLYGGRCGVALLFAALESRGLTAGDSFARRILAPLVDDVASDARRGAWQPKLPLGACGLGGIVYGLATAATLTKSDSLIAAAARAAATITPDAVATDDRIDVLFGAAGAALGLLALSTVWNEPWVIDRAVLCGRHLLDRAIVGGPGRRLVWRTLNGRVVDGFAHGSAGIGYALARLHRQTAVDEFREAAIAALCGNGHHDHHEVATSNSNGASTARTDMLRRSWCQGTAGTGLSRLEASVLLGCPDLRAGLGTVLTDLASAPISVSRLDQVCCGNMGRIELLTRAAEMLDAHEWRRAAERCAENMIARAAERGSYGVSGVDDLFCPGYYQGLAGIGYGLLRLQFRELPPVMLWE